MVSLLVVYAPTCLPVCQVHIDSLLHELGLSTLDNSGLIVLPASMRCACVHTHIHTHHTTRYEAMRCNIYLEWHFSSQCTYTCYYTYTYLCVCVHACMCVIMCEASKLLSVCNVTPPPFSAFSLPLPLALHPSLHQLTSLVLRSTSTDAWINERQLSCTVRTTS